MVEGLSDLKVACNGYLSTRVNECSLSQHYWHCISVCCRTKLFVVCVYVMKEDSLAPTLVDLALEVQLVNC